MLRNRFYYGLKPLMPRSVTRAVRGWMARRKRGSVMEKWPILPGSERPPEGWPGWPDGKQFALVLTHDVEGMEGLEKCRQLKDIELKLGFRSSFNFVPEGSYSVPPRLLDDLTVSGFEVGVHDLYHDGRLYNSRTKFARAAMRINRHLKAWGVVGFRSAFMLHNLDWLHDLNIDYDCSTFDTDPFEPQPDGQRTIFPFWVGKEHGAAGAAGPGSLAMSSAPGYAELPYTLPQDSTLFLLLRDHQPDVWFQKVDWVARHGGMALMNTHPDYMAMNGGVQSEWEYPVALYEQFLEYVRSRYAGRYWHALPREVAAVVARHRFQRPRKPRRACMVTYSHYRSDARVIRYAEALTERGDHLDVLALRRSPSEPVREKVGRVNLVNLQSRTAKRERSHAAFLFPTLRFFVSAATWIARENARRRYDLLHIHNVPDFLVFAGWLPRLTGARVILDIHDIVPEFYASKFGVDHNSAIFTLLKWMERVSARTAHHVIISNHLWRDTYAARTRANGKCSVFINNVDARVFRPRPRTRDDDRIIVLFPGGLQWHQGLDIAIRAFQKVRAEIPTAEFHVYGDGNMKSSLVALAAELGLAESVHFFPPVPVSQIADVMANADLGVVPKRADSFGNEAYSTKIMEFMAVGVPVVVSNTKIDRYYFDDSVVRFFESGNPEALAVAMIEILRDAQLRRRLVASASEYVAANAWESRKRDYLALVDALLLPGRATPGPRALEHANPARD